MGYKVSNMIKPSFPEIVLFSPKEIRLIRDFYKMSREKFARFFPVSAGAIKSWEIGTRNPYGPAAVRLQELKAYADHVKAEKEDVLKKVLGRNKNVGKTIQHIRGSWGIANYAIPIRNSLHRPEGRLLLRASSQ